jgi:hypothetical protein
MYSIFPTAKVEISVSARGRKQSPDGRKFAQSGHSDESVLIRCYGEENWHGGLFFVN